MQRRVGEHQRRGRASAARPRRRRRRRGAAGRPRSGAPGSQRAAPRRSRSARPARRAVSRSGAISANGLLLAVLARAQLRDRLLVVGAAGEVEAAEALDREDRPAAERRAAAASIGSRRRRRREIRAVAADQPGPGPQSGQALGWAWKRRSAGSSYSARQRPHISKPSHRRQRAVVGHAADDREAGAAVGAVDERVAMAAVGRIEQLRQAVRAGRGVGRDQGLRLRRSGAEPEIRNRSSPSASTSSAAIPLDGGQRGRLGGEPVEELRSPPAAVPSTSSRTPRRSLRT